MLGCCLLLTALTVVCGNLLADQQSYFWHRQDAAELLLF